jgi:hypothetical protein
VWRYASLGKLDSFSSWLLNTYKSRYLTGLLGRRFYSSRAKKIVHSAFWYFWLTVQNTANRHVSNAFGLIAVFILFPLVCAEAGEANFPFPLRPRISCARPFFFGGGGEKKRKKKILLKRPGPIFSAVDVAVVLVVYGRQHAD